MNLAVRKPMSLAEFLVWEERQELRYEFDGVLPVAMTGGTAGHATIQRNLVLAVGGRLRGKSCQFYGSDLKIQVADDHIRYPSRDALDAGHSERVLLAALAEAPAAPPTMLVFSSAAIASQRWPSLIPERLPPQYLQPSSNRSLDPNHLKPINS